MSYHVKTTLCHDITTYDISWQLTDSDREWSSILELYFCTSLAPRPRPAFYHLQYTTLLLYEAGFC